MRLLFVTHTVPYPPRTGNALLAYHHLRHLGKRHSIDLLTFCNSGRPDLGDLTTWCRRVELVQRPRRVQALLRRAAGFLNGVPPLVASVRSARMTFAVDQFLRDEPYDIVLFQLSHMAQFRPAWYNGRTVWFMEDPLVLRSQRWLERYPWYMRPGVRGGIARLQRYEQRQAPRFSRVLLLNEADARDYRDVLPGAMLDWVPYGVDPDAFCPPKNSPRREGMIVLSGNMDHPPNVDAVEYFCRIIFPLVRQQVPAAGLWLVGARPVAEVTKWAADPHITVTGSVPDLRPYLTQATVSVCPVRLKIGTQTKVLEALACGTPVVTTSAGNNGIRGVSGEHLYVADDPASFAANVVSLLRGEQWSKLAEQGRQLVLDNFTWEMSARRLEQICTEVLHEPRPRGSLHRMVSPSDYRT